MNSTKTTFQRYLGPGRLMPSLRLIFQLTLIIAFFLVNHDLWYSIHQTNDDSALAIAAVTAAGNLQRQICFIAVGAVSILVLVKYRDNYRVPRGGLGLLMLGFVGWCAVSVSWADDPWLVVRRLGVFAILCLAALAFTCEFSTRDMLTFIAASTATYLAIGVCAELLLGAFHPFEAGYRFAGTVHPNNQGTNCAMLCLSSFALLRRSGQRRLLPLAGVMSGALFLVLTESRTAFASVLVVFAIYGLVVAPIKRYAALVLCLFLTVGTLGVLIEESTVSAGRHAVLLGREDEGSSSLDARIELWQDLATYVEQRPILGFGYDAFWTPAHIMDVSGRQQWTICQSHSEYVEVALDLGIVGLSLYLLLIVSALHRSIQFVKDEDEGGMGIYFGLLLFYILDGVLEAPFSIHGLLTFIAMTSIARLALASPARQLHLDIEIVGDL
jgi:exopolysaccharide production protein ExoQ